jgi:hypothetical protein
MRNATFRALAKAFIQGQSLSKELIKDGGRSGHYAISPAVVKNRCQASLQVSKIVLAIHGSVIKVSEYGYLVILD